MSEQETKEQPVRRFTASQISFHPAEVFRHAAKDGKIEINHQNYPDIIFVMTTRPRRKD